MNIDTERLVKLLNLTRSDNDHEALAAIRMANKMIDEAKKSWGDLIGSGVDDVLKALHQAAGMAQRYRSPNNQWHEYQRKQQQYENNQQAQQAEQDLANEYERFKKVWKI